MGLPGREGQGLGNDDGGQERVRWRDVRGRKKSRGLCLSVGGRARGPNRGKRGPEEGAE